MSSFLFKNKVNIFTIKSELATWENGIFNLFSKVLINKSGYSGIICNGNYSIKNFSNSFHTRNIMSLKFIYMTFEPIRISIVTAVHNDIDEKESN